MKKIMFWAVAAIALTACNKEEESEFDADYIACSAGFTVQDTKGNDLLTEEYFDIPGFRVSYFDEQGEEVTLYNPNLLYKYGYAVDKANITHKNTEIADYNILRILLENFGNCWEYGEDGTSAMVTTYFHWSEELTDKFVTKFERGKGYLIIKEIYMNGELLWKYSLYNQIPYVKIVIDDNGQRTFTALDNPFANSKPEYN